MEKALLLLLLFLLSLVVADDNIQVFRSTGYNGGKAISGGKLLDSRNVSIFDITLCIRFFHKEAKPLIVIEDWKNPNVDSSKVFSLISLGTWYPLTFLGFGHPKAKGSYKSWVMRDPNYPEYSYTFNKWSHICLAYGQKQGSFIVVMDGKVTNINSVDPEFTQVKIPSNFLSKIVIGRCNSDASDEYWCDLPEGQQLSDFNIWSRALTAKEMQDWTTCSDMIKGDIVSWSTAKFDLANMTIEQHPVSYVCAPPSPGRVFFPEARNISSHIAICQKMRGVTSTINNNATQVAMYGEVKDFPESCQGVDFWVGYWDVPVEGQFSSISTGKLLTAGMFAAWNLGEPNGDTLENCAVVHDFGTSWLDVGCNAQYCGFCDLEIYPVLNIRGLCLSTLFDSKFSWTRAMLNKRYKFTGYANSQLIWNLNNNRTQWKIELYRDESIYAVTNVTEYPLGTYTWKIFGDYCYEKYETEVVLNINACNSSEFNCVSGDCVLMDQRCDGKVDCPDKTDEIGCIIFTTDESYLKDVPPPSIVEGRPEKVKVAIDVLTILEINEVTNVINLQLLLCLTWLDKRLTMFNLKVDKDLNTLTPAFRSMIWIPEIVFYNTQEKLESLNDEKAFVTIIRNGSFQMSTRDNLQNFYTFKGEENPLSISRVYNAEFLCQFNMAIFPFDTQVCSVIVVLKGNAARFVEMEKDGLKYLGPVDLTQYFVKNTTMTYYTIFPNITSVKVDIIFGRRLLGTILTTYLPTILICLVSFCTNYFKAFFFEANVSVNLTCLLVLATLFISVSTSMTKTSYIKMIDVWFIFNLFIPFAEVLLITFIDNLREDEEKEGSHHERANPAKPQNAKVGHKTLKIFPVDLISKDEDIKQYMELVAKSKRDELKLKIALQVANRGLPILFVLFLVAYFGVGVYFYYN